MFSATDDPNLLAALREFIRAVANSLHSFSRPTLDVEIPSPGQFGYATEQVVDPTGLVDASTIANESPQLTEVMNALHQSPIVDRRLFTPSPSVDEEDWKLKQVIWFFVHDYLREVGLRAHLWNAGVFNRLSSSLIDSLREGATRVECYAPVYSLEGAATVNRRIGEVTLYVPPRATLLRISESYFSGQRMATRWDRTPRYFLKRQIKIPFDQIMTALPIEPFLTATTALRLAAGGYAHIRELILLPSPGSAQHDVLYRYDVQFPSATETHPLELTKLTPSVLTKTIQLADNLRTMWDEFGVAIRRYAMTGTRQEHEDRLIDATIALESLLTSDSSAEMTFRLSHRGAWLIGSTAEQRQQTARLLKDLYDARSKLIHGDRHFVRVRGAQLPQYAEQAVAVVQRVLRIVAMRPYRRAEWDELVAAIVLSGNRPQEMEMPT